MSDCPLNTVSLAGVEPRRLEWLWEHRIPKGKITLIEGDPGLGKSTLTMQIAADVTMGRALPEHFESNMPGNVLIVSSEDDIEDTIAPRLVAAGADLTRISCLRSVGPAGVAGHEEPGILGANFGRTHEALRPRGWQRPASALLRR